MRHFFSKSPSVRRTFMEKASFWRTVGDLGKKSLIFEETIKKDNFFLKMKLFFPKSPTVQRTFWVNLGEKLDFEKLNLKLKKLKKKLSHENLIRRYEF